MAHPIKYTLGRWLLGDAFPENGRFTAPDEKPRRTRVVAVPVVAQRQSSIRPDDIPQDVARLGASSGITAAATGKAKVPEGELGVTGLNVLSGRIRQEYNETLQTLSSRMVAYEEMRRSDSALAAMEAIITLPIRQAEWRIEPGEDKQLSDRISQNLFHEMSHSLDDMLREAVLAVLYGFTIHEKVFERKADGFEGWRKFAERERSTVKEWDFDDTGGLRGIVQTGRNPSTGEYLTTNIPIEKLIVWTWRREAGNPEGIGAFRQAYKHWNYKKWLEEFAAIRIERQACGIPTAEAPPDEDTTEGEAEEVLAILQSIRTANDAGLILPHGWTVNMLDLGAADVPFESHIERQHQSMLQCVLGHFVGLAQGGDSGAWALSRDSSSFFLMALEGIADWLEDAFNRYAVAQIISFNPPGYSKDPPRLTHGKIGVRDLDAFSRSVARLFTEKVELPDEIEEFIREEFDLPAVPTG